METHDKMNSDSLFNPKNRGGVIGGGGYNFQDSYIITQLPKWLKIPEFHSFIKEGIDDVDVKFENDEVSKTWHYQFKNHKVGIKDLREISQNFIKISKHPGIKAERFILVCCGSTDDISSLWKKIKEYRELKKIHDDNSTLESTKLELIKDIKKINFIQKLGSLEKINDLEYIDFILDKLTIEEEHPVLNETDPIHLMDLFRGRFIELPFDQKSPKIIDEIFKELHLHINKANRKVIKRDYIESLINNKSLEVKKKSVTVVYLHGWSKQKYDLPADIEVDWTKHFDYSKLKVPSLQIWKNELIPEIQRLRESFDGDAKKRNICLHSKACLSAGIAFGRFFPDAAGYNIQIEQPSPGSSKAIQYWKSNTPITKKFSLDVRESVNGKNSGKEVIVAIGVTGDPESKIKQYIEHESLLSQPSLYIFPDGGPDDICITEETAVAFAQAAKQEMRKFCNKYDPQLIHLFYFGPLGLAVLLGQKMNGLADIQCYERSKVSGYTPSCFLAA